MSRCVASCVVTYKGRRNVGATAPSRSSQVTAPVLRDSPAVPGQARGHCPYEPESSQLLSYFRSALRTYGCSGRLVGGYVLGANLRVRPLGRTGVQTHRYVPWVTTEPGEGRHVGLPLRRGDIVGLSLTRVGSGSVAEGSAG